MGFTRRKRRADRTESDDVFERLQTVAGGAVTATLHLGSLTPLAPVCVTLQGIRDGLEAVRDRKERLEELHGKCELLTTYAIAQDDPHQSELVTLLKKRVDKLDALVKTYAERSAERSTKRSKCMAYVHVLFLSDSKIDSLERGIDTVVNVMNLAASTRKAAAAEGWMRRFDNLEAMLKGTHVTAKITPVPKNAPRAKGWHIFRGAAMRAVHTCLAGDEGAHVVGIVGPSGSGKSTLAAAVVGERGGFSRRGGDRSDQGALAEIDSVREMFPDGIAWLRVGRGVNTPDRLRELMQELAKRLHKDVMKCVIEAPQLGEDGTSYVRKAVANGNGGMGLRCLVVADDVWDAKVVDKLRETGMRVLITTRERSLVEEGKRVSVDTLTDSEARNLLRATVQLPRGADLPDEAMTILDRCDNVAMYVEFVGRWSILQAGEDRAPQGRGAWVKAVRAIDRNLDLQADDAKDKRLAILHAGFKYLGRTDVLAQELYMALAVLPDGHPFAVSDAAALLFDDGEAQHSMTCAKRAIVRLEQWAVITPDESDVDKPGMYRYHMHDAHIAFGKERLMAHEDVRQDAVRRWTDVISAPSYLCSADSFTLISMWRALEHARGVSWRMCRRYDAALNAMDVSDTLFRKTAEATAVLYYAEGDVNGAESLMQAVLDRCYDNEEADPKVVMSALWFCMEAAKLRGDAQKSEQLRNQLGPLMAELQKEALFGMESSDDAEKCFSLHMFGLCRFEMGDKEKAERLHRRALKAQQGCGLGESHPLVAHTMYSLGVCLRDNGRLPEAEMYLERTVEVLQARLTSGDLQVAYAKRKLACVVRESNRPSDAAVLLKESLEIFRTELDSENLQVAVTLHELGRSFLAAGWPSEARTELQEALAINETLSEPPDDGQLLDLEHDLESCEPRAGSAQARTDCRILENANLSSSSKVEGGKQCLLQSLRKVARCTTSLVCQSRRPCRGVFMPLACVIWLIQLIFVNSGLRR